MGLIQQEECLDVLTGSCKFISSVSFKTEASLFTQWGFFLYVVSLSGPFYVIIFALFFTFKNLNLFTSRI